MQRLPQLIERLLNTPTQQEPQAQFQTDPDIPHISLAEEGRKEIIYPRYRNVLDDSFRDNDDGSGDPFMYRDHGWVHAVASRSYARKDLHHDQLVPGSLKVEGNRLYINSLTRGLGVYDLNQDGSMTLVGEDRNFRIDDRTFLVQDGQLLAIGPVLGSRPASEPDKTGLGVRTRLELYDTREAKESGDFAQTKYLEVKGAVVTARVVHQRLYVVTYDPTHCWSCERFYDRVYVHVLDAQDLSKLEPLQTFALDPSSKNAFFGGLAKITPTGILLSQFNEVDNDPSGSPRPELWFLDISDPNAQLRASGPMVTTRKPRRINEVSQHGNYLRVYTIGWSAKDAVLEVFWLAHPDGPQKVGALKIEEMLGLQFMDFLFDESRAYAVITEGEPELGIIDLSRPDEPRLAGRIPLASRDDLIVPDGERLVILQPQSPHESDKSNIQLWDVSSTDSPRLLSELSAPSMAFDPTGGNDGMHVEKLLRYLPGKSGLWFPFGRNVTTTRELSVSGSAQSQTCEFEKGVYGMARLDWKEDELRIDGRVLFWDDARFAALTSDEIFTVGLGGIRRYSLREDKPFEFLSESSLYMFPRVLASAPQGKGYLYRLLRSSQKDHRKLQVISRSKVDSIGARHQLELDLNPQGQHCADRRLVARLYAAGERAHVVTYNGGKGRKQGASILTVDASEGQGMHQVDHSHFDLHGLSYWLRNWVDGIRVREEKGLRKGNHLILVNHILDDQGARTGSSELVVFDVREAQPKLLHRFLRPATPYFGGLFQSGEHEVSSWYAEPVSTHPGKLQFVWQRIRLEEDGRVTMIPTKVPGLPLAQSADGWTGLVLSFEPEDFSEDDARRCLAQPYVFYYDKTDRRCHRLLPQLKHVALLGEDSMVLSTQSLVQPGFRLAKMFRAGRRILLTHLPHQAHGYNPVQLGAAAFAPASTSGEAHSAKIEPTDSSQAQEAPGRRHQLFSISDSWEVKQADLTPFLAQEDTRLRMEGPDRILRRVGWNDGDLIEIRGDQELALIKRFDRVGDSCFSMDLTGGETLWCRGNWEGIFGRTSTPVSDSEE